MVIAISIAIVAMTGAVLTYLSIQQESAAVENDRRSVVETVLVQNHEVSAETQARAEGVFAARYRQLMAEADALSGTDADEAFLLRLDAASFDLNGVSFYLTGTGPTARFDYSTALQAGLTAGAATTPPVDEPDRTARLADQDRVISKRIAMSVTGLLCVVVFLTIARLTEAEQRRRGVFAAAALGYVVAVITAIAQFF